EAAGDRLDRRQRVVDLVADDANQPLPCLPLFVAQRPADVGEDEQLMRTSALPERRAPYFPAAGGAGERDVLDARGLAGETRAQPQLLGGASKQLLGRLREQALAGAIDQAQRLSAVEGEDGDVDLDHHRAQQRAGLERAEPL